MIAIMFLTKSVVISLVTAFGVMLMQKLGFRAYLIERGTKLISRMAECDFCFCWWTNVLFCLLIASVTGEWIMLLSALIATPITRALIQ